MRGQEAGFTIIEVVLFLAISGLLLLMMFIGTGSMASRQRFTDTTDSLHAFFQTQYDEVVNGVNIRTSSSDCPSDANSEAGMSGVCLKLGKLLTINGTTITSQYVLYTNPVLDSATAADQAKIEAAKITVVDTGKQVYELKWGASAYKSTRSTPSPVTGSTGRGEIDSVAIVWTPNSGKVAQLYYKATQGNPTNSLRKALEDDPKAYNPPVSNAGPSLAVCVGNTLDWSTNSVRSAIVFAQGGAGGGITTNYAPGSDVCP